MLPKVIASTWPVAAKRALRLEQGKSQDELGLQQQAVSTASIKPRSLVPVYFFMEAVNGRALLDFDQAVCPQSAETDTCHCAGYTPLFDAYLIAKAILVEHFPGSR